MLVFDLETASDESALPLLPPCSAPGNYKDPDKIAAAIAEKMAERNGRLALDPDCCRIVALGYTDVGGDVQVLPCRDEEDEVRALAQFWAAWAIVGERPIGYNCVAFDAPVLIQRSRILGVTSPYITLRKYGSPDMDDLMLDLSFGGLADYKTMRFWARRLALDVPKDATSGKDIAAFVASDDWAAIVEHCRLDVITTAALARRIYPGVR
jgi:hypothetical protein